MSLRDRFIAIAAGEIGYFRRPGTATKYGEWYGLPTGAWCAMFLSWVAEQAGATSVFPKHAYTPSGANWFKARNQWHTGNAGIRRGDILYFDFPGAPNRISHVAVAESDWNPSGGYVETIEGNTSGPGGDQRNGGALLRKRRSAWIVGYGRPNWGGERDYLQKGDVGDAVRNMQQHLINAGYSVGPAGADGHFGDGTEQGLIAFQAANGLEPDGVFGPASRGVLYGGAQPESPKPIFHGTPGVHTGRLTADGNLELVLDGDFGAASTGRLQQVMGTPIDYVISPVSAAIAAVQRFLNAVIPAVHIRNLTGRNSLTPDGIEGAKTTSVLQFYLYNTYGPAVLGRGARGGDFDGVRGPVTNKLWQYALNQARAGSGRF